MTEVSSERRVDNRPGATGGFEHGTVMPPREPVSSLPQISERDARIAADESKVGTPEHDGAVERIGRVMDLVRWNRYPVQ